MSSAPPRRFKVEPIETTTMSSKDRKSSPDAADKPTRPPRKFAPQPVETSTRTVRKFAPEPIETTKRAVRKFAPQPIETTTRSSRAKPTSPLKSPGASRDKFAHDWEAETAVKKEKRSPRKFTPQLIETAQRSRRTGDKGPVIPPSHKTEIIGDAGDGAFKRNRRASPPNATPISIHQNPLFLEIQRATSPNMMRRPSSFSSMRSQHSFRVPDLEPIESSESEESTPPSPATSPSNSDHSYMYTEATRMRESVDERFSGYLLELAAKAAEAQLQEQAMAAFANNDHHEPVDHFIDHESEGSGSSMDKYATEAVRRRDSSWSEVNYDMLAMRKHREEQQQKEQESPKGVIDDGRPDPTKYNPFGRNVAAPETKDAEMDGMRKSARPPMLGSDIRFPRCESPEPSRFDPTQGCDAVKITMCYLAEQSQQAEKGEGLWCGGSNKSNESATPSLYSNNPSRQPSRSSNNGHGSNPGGLWGGCCVNSGNTPPRGPTGILTPAVEISNPFSPCPTPQMSLLPPTPPASQTDFACIDDKLATEAAIDEDFGDNFVTQVYNYLSLGYPSIARMFDEELSKISHIPVSELRQDDHLATSRGYIRLGEDGNLTDSDITEETCSRWRALRVYVREWARQHPKMASDQLLGGMGTAVRKGSWAV
ncbi:hypothetical protein BU24DRAFT_464062 [Aaosphaeria arxii CBS 175.79]|uniref:Uncharacterized protein n=1 Tax=Aaosphaeria arxii CBS 175.79 TaxID=1450172 RepID=A0A6A5XKI8_9PLEO|nr:uncharacterized protein BU24DRAFT_464062 [Aaosphaeria arxii CBS 175.79]KAF2013250.1 hypothetical protein BU24DRAFT_464062 [Aaosphaeria arxii CBS 175.79]